MFLNVNSRKKTETYDTLMNSDILKATCLYYFATQCQSLMTSYLKMAAIKHKFHAVPI